MPEAAGEPLLRLLAWFSPAFPVGSFSYSHGLESAVHSGPIVDAADLEAWLAALLDHGSGWNDAVLFAAAWRAAHDSEALAELAELAEALAGSEERHRETTLQGVAFLQAAAHWPGATPSLDAAPYCIAAGASAGTHAIPLETALLGWLQAFATAQLQAAIRLGVTGQAGAVATLGALSGPLLNTARRAAASELVDLGGAAIRAEIAAILHETQETRLFRT